MSKIRNFSAALLTLWLLSGSAHAQTAPAVEARPQLEGHTLDGRPLDLVALRGKVVLLMFWSTDCAVCRDKMAELRRNVAGWRGQPFELVAVATDARKQDVVDYDALLQRMVPGSERFAMLWRADPAHHDGFGALPRLPATFLIDREGRIVERFSGRIPPEAWDRIADLMP
jgi:peroxiredoxin